MPGPTRAGEGKAIIFRVKTKFFGQKANSQKWKNVFRPIENLYSPEMVETAENKNLTNFN